MTIHKHPVYDTDLHLIIDPVTRAVKNESKKSVLMQNDHNSERFTFEIPRYVDGHDMSLCNVVQVHYINIDSSDKSKQNADIYPVADLQISNDSDAVVIGSWLVSNNATFYAGSLNFIFRFACVDEDTSEITYQWFSDIFTGIKISKGIYNTDVLTEENSNDILEAWKGEVIAAAQENAKIITDEIKCMLDEANKTLLEYEQRVEGTMFTVNFETGNLEYISPDYTFEVNEDTGNLEWSTNKKSLEEQIDTLYTTKTDAKVNALVDDVSSLKQQVSNLKSGKSYISVGDTEPTTYNTLWLNTKNN